MPTSTKVPHHPSFLPDNLPSKFRSKSRPEDTFEAFQWTDHARDVPQWLKGRCETDAVQLKVWQPDGTVVRLGVVVGLRNGALFVWRDVAGFLRRCAPVAAPVPAQPPASLVEPIDITDAQLDELYERSNTFVTQSEVRKLVLFVWRDVAGFLAGRYPDSCLRPRRCAEHRPGRSCQDEDVFQCDPAAQAREGVLMERFIFPPAGKVADAISVGDLPDDDVRGLQLLVRDNWPAFQSLAALVAHLQRVQPPAAPVEGEAEDIRKLSATLSVRGYSVEETAKILSKKDDPTSWAGITLANMARVRWRQGRGNPG